MRPLLFALFALVVLALAAGETQAQCRGGRCGPHSSTLDPQSCPAIFREARRGDCCRARPLRNFAARRPVRRAARAALRPLRALGKLVRPFRCRGCH